ncbi:ATP-binding protein [Streptomyces sp. NPDC017940]|uniref:ATP-binding protein n=1 Tax=Streptomyces sp. NPDC017940 TaxID=3365017 RepID=UPI0037B66014
MKITPSARVLRMLGEIEFDEWQCIAELTDNAFDDFAEILRAGQPWAGGYKVSVSLPSNSIKSSDAQVIVSDNGRGMSYETLERSVRAGWSSNNQFDKLGLFGMGFNVATARLGRRTRVLTTRQGDTQWIGVEIDLDRIGDDFEAEDITLPKNDPNEHGTRVEISRLNDRRADWLRRNATNLRNTLGRTYSWILDNRPFELWVQGVRVLPRRHCRWGDDRYVTYGSGVNAERIPAYIPIDEKLADAEACLDCGHWQTPGKEACEQCEGDRLSRRERRIHGWLGVQRHLDKREFGIDFLRNGRKILQWDKQLFTWHNPDAPFGAEEPEYPIELANQGGRLIGEIHLDHVPVTYQKDAFEYSDRSWRSAVELLRGAGPLQPKRAKQLEYPENASALGRLFKGFRRNQVGIRCLIPGDGSKPIHAETRRWAGLFHAGDPDYQSDQRWWDAVAYHEERNKQGKHEQIKHSSPEQADEQAVLDALGFSSPTLEISGETEDSASEGESDSDSTSQSGSAEEQEIKETKQERIARYMRSSVVLPELTREFGQSQLGFLAVEARRMMADELVDDDGRPMPVLLLQGAGSTATAFIDLEQEIFKTYGTEPADLILSELAALLKVRADSSLSPSQIIAILRRSSLPDSALSLDSVRADSRELLNEIRGRMCGAVDLGDPNVAYQHLDTDEYTATESEMIARGLITKTSDLGKDGEFLLYAPPLFLPKVLESEPELFMDGKVFRGPYETVSSPSARRLSLARVTGYLSDVAMLVSLNGGIGASQLKRTRISVQLLSDEMAGEEG